MKRIIICIQVVTFFMLSTCISSCFCNKCEEAEDNVRSMPRDTALMYFWRQIYFSNRDTSYVGYYPNGDVKSGYKIIDAQKSSNSRPWAASNGVVTGVQCGELGMRGDYFHYKYKISGDTLFTWNVDPKKMDTLYRTKVKLY